MAGHIGSSPQQKRDYTSIVGSYFAEQMSVYKELPDRIL